DRLRDRGRPPARESPWSSILDLPQARHRHQGHRDAAFLQDLPRRTLRYERRSPRHPGLETVSPGQLAPRIDFGKLHQHEAQVGLLADLAEPFDDDARFFSAEKFVA